MVAVFTKICPIHLATLITTTLFLCRNFSERKLDIKSGALIVHHWISTTQRQLTLVSIEASTDVHLLTADNNYSLPCRNICRLWSIILLSDTKSESSILKKIQAKGNFILDWNNYVECKEYLKREPCLPTFEKESA